MNLRMVGAVAIMAIGGANAARANLIVNGGFEDGVASVTADVSIGEDALMLTNDNVPVGWTASPGFDIQFWNGVTTIAAYDGNFALFLGNDPGYPLASLSQTFGTTAGETYEVSLELANVRPTGYFQVLIDGTAEMTVTGLPWADSPPGDCDFETVYADGGTSLSAPSSPLQYTSEVFRFVGTGSDTLTLAGVNDEASFEIDDVAVSAVPEPSGLAVLLGGGALLGASTIWRRRTGRDRRRD